MQKSLLSTLLIITILLSACLRPYTPAVQQGNVITPEMVSQVKVGMTQDEVQYLLGAPVLQPTFDNSRWDYIYTYKAKSSPVVEEKSVSVYFNSEGKVTRIQNDLTSKKLAS